MVKVEIIKRDWDLERPIKIIHDDIEIFMVKVDGKIVYNELEK